MGEDQTDEDLVRRIVRDGDEGALETLVQRHLDGVYRLVSLRVARVQDAEDLVQEVFLAVHRSLPAFRFQARFSTWLYRIVMNTVGQHYRRRARRPEGRGLGATDPPTRDFDPPTRVSMHEELRQLREAVAELPEAYRSAFVLRTAQDLSYQEIAEILGCPRGTVDSRIARARALLAKKLRRT